MPDRPLHVAHLGRVPYGVALELQREVARRVIAHEIEGDVLLLLEHPPVVTMGRSSKQAHLVASRGLLAARGVELFEVERGGDVTFHGPGQLVGYPIVDLKAAPHRQDLHWYLRQLEEMLIRALASLGIEATRNAGYTGVWVGTGGCDPSAGSARGPRAAAPLRKIASIGVHARDWVTWHGFAINVTTDLTHFDLIVPCGIQNVAMTSVAMELPAQPVNATEFASRVVSAFASTFAVNPIGDSALRFNAPAVTAPASR